MARKNRTPEENARLNHAFPNQCLLLLRHHHMKMNTLTAFLCHHFSHSPTPMLVAPCSPHPVLFPGAGVTEPNRCSQIAYHITVLFGEHLYNFHQVSLFVYSTSLNVFVQILPPCTQNYSFTNRSTT